MNVIHLAAVFVIELFAQLEKALCGGFVVARVIALTEHVHQFLPGAVTEFARGVTAMLLDNHPIGRYGNVLLDSLAEQKARQKPFENVLLVTRAHIQP